MNEIVSISKYVEDTVKENREVIISRGDSISLAELKKYVDELISLSPENLESKYVSITYEDIYEQTREEYKEKFGYCLYEDQYITLNFDFVRKGTPEELESFKQKDQDYKEKRKKQIEDGLEKIKQDEKALKKMLKSLE